MTYPTPTGGARYRRAAIAIFPAALALAAAAQGTETANKYTDESYEPAFSEADVISRLDSTRAELARRTGEVPVWTSGTVHPVTTAEWFLDAGRTVTGGKVLPGAPFSPVTTDEGDAVIESGMVKVRLTGWQLTDVPRVLYADAGERVLLATLGGDAQEARVTGAPVTLPLTGQTWQPVDLHGWIAEADLTAHTAALWDHAQALYTANCALCHAAPHLDEFDANTWSGQFDAMLSTTNLLKEEARLVKTYLQLHAAELPREGSGAPTAMGQMVYEQLCLSCHGEDAREGSGGDIRGSDFRAVRNAAGGVETMPQIVMAEAEMRAVAAYLTALADGS